MKHPRLTFGSILARVWHRSPIVPEGLAASGITLGEIARLSPDEALRSLLGTAGSLTPEQVATRLRSVHTIIGELVSRSVSQLNLLLLTLAVASYLSGDQRVAIARADSG